MKTLSIIWEIIKNLLNIIPAIFRSCYNPFTNDCAMGCQSMGDCPICENFHRGTGPREFTRGEMLRWWFKGYTYVAVINAIRIPIILRNIDFTELAKNFERERLKND